VIIRLYLSVILIYFPASRRRQNQPWSLYCKVWRQCGSSSREKRRSTWFLCQNESIWFPYIKAMLEEAGW